jgi:NAD(P)-dependent dehydrogenase (short-subunit alcohol dehydrogenase family)
MAIVAAYTTSQNRHKETTEANFLKETPVGRGTTPQDIACAVAFFASDVSSDIVGQIFSISGGSSFQ